MALSPQFAEYPIIAMANLGAANTSRTGSGSPTDLLTGKMRVVSVTADYATDVISWTAHSLKNGDKIFFPSGTLPTGLSLNTYYYVIDASTDDFKLAATTDGAVINMTATNGSNIVLAYQGGTRVERIRFTTTGPNINTASVGRVFLAGLDGTYRIFYEVSLAAVTPSSSAIGSQGIISFTGGLLIPAGWKVGVTIGAWVDADDTCDVIAEGADL